MPHDDSARVGEMFEIRWHGRGGQGAKTASNLLAQSALSLGKYVQAMPEFGAERGGAPVVAYTRISDKPIRIHYGIRHPRVILVLDETLIGQVNVAEGLAEGGTILVNTKMTPQQVFKPLYRALIGQESGPRAGWFLSILPRDWLIKRLNLEE